MKNLFCYLTLLLCVLNASAQNVYFVYFETDNTQPFYLKMDDKVYSSTSTGNFILPNLSDGTYNLSIGFPSTASEARFTLTVEGKDRGYAIKNFDFGLGLYDLQSSSVTRPQADLWKKNVTYQYRNNEFTSLLARASNDTSLYYIPIISKEEDVVQQAEPKPQAAVNVSDDTGKSAASAAVVTEAVVVATEKETSADKTVPPVVLPASADSVAITATVPVEGAPVYTDSAALGTTDSLKKETVVSGAEVLVATAGVAAAIQADTIALENAAYQRSVVKRFHETSTVEGFSLVFHDVFRGGQDTISLIIPNPPIILKEADTLRFEDGLLEIKKDSATIPASTGAVKTVPKSNCTAVATDNDFLKLRRNMAAKSNDEDMIQEAKKTFRSKCFSTGQVKNLSTLFLNDEGKYQFFDAAYTRVTDQAVFYALGQELKEEYYIKRFKALIGE